MLVMWQESLTNIFPMKAWYQWARFSRPAAKWRLLSWTSPDLAEYCQSPVPIHPLTARKVCEEIFENRTFMYHADTGVYRAITLISSSRNLYVTIGDHKVLNSSGFAGSYPRAGQFGFRPRSPGPSKLSTSREGPGIPPLNWCQHDT